jgi:hypothetical protein
LHTEQRIEAQQLPLIPDFAGKWPAESFFVPAGIAFATQPPRISPRLQQLDPQFD